MANQMAPNGPPNLHDGPHKPPKFDCSPPTRTTGNLNHHHTPAHSPKYIAFAPMMRTGCGRSVAVTGRVIVGAVDGGFGFGARVSQARERGVADGSACLRWPVSPDLRYFRWGCPRVFLPPMAPVPDGATTTRSCWPWSRRSLSHPLRVGYRLRW